MCADLGSRTIREEIDAMEVLGINPVQRLVTPRMLVSVSPQDQFLHQRTPLDTLGFDEPESRCRLN